MNTFLQIPDKLRNIMDPQLIPIQIATSLRACLKPPPLPVRHRKIHPNSSGELELVSASDGGATTGRSTISLPYDPFVKEGGFEVIPDHENEYWTLTRTGLNNLSKRLKARNKIGTGDEEAESPPAPLSALEIAEDLQLGRVTLRPAIIRPEKKPIGVSASDLKVFCSNPQLEDESLDCHTTSSLKSCLKKRPNPLDKFLCVGPNDNDSNSNSGGGGGSGFRKFLTVPASLSYITLITLVIFYISVHPVACEVDVGIIRRQALIQDVWNELTKEEITAIFGREHRNSDFKAVPNFDIIQPQLVHRKARGKRSPSESSDPGIKQIQIKGLGRQFDIRLTPNKNLLDPHFVFLSRNENRSEIMPEHHVRKELNCFYHGTVKHFPETQNSIGDKVEGSVALRLCDDEGMKGFILPQTIHYDEGKRGSAGQPDNDNFTPSNHHYVIHPLPSRLFHSDSSTLTKHSLQPYSDFVNSTVRKNNEDDEYRHETQEQRHHILYKLDFGKHAKSHSKKAKSISDVTKPREQGVVAESESVKQEQLLHDCVHNDKQSNSGQIHRRRRRSATSSSDIFLPSDRSRSVRSRDYFDSYWIHQFNSQPRNRGYDDFYDQKPKLYQPAPVITPSFHTLSKSSSTSSAFPSSFWSHKTVPSTSSSSSSELFDRVPFNPGATGAGNIGLTFSRRSFNEDDYDHDHDASATNDNQWSTQSSSSSVTSSRSSNSVSSRDRDARVLIYESTASEEPDTVLPFYTKGKKNKAKGGKMPKSSNWIPTSGERFANYTNSNNGNWSKYRKGRRDDVYFGLDWKSRLDADLKDGGQSLKDKTFMEKRGRFDSIDSNSIYSKETSKNTYSNNEVPLSQLTIETAVFIDKDLFKHMQSNFPDDTHGEIVRIVLAMINAVQLLYQDPSLGHKVDFVLKRLEVLESDPPGLIRPYDIDRFLTNFCKWQKTENPTSDADPLHWDHALILTGLDLYVVHPSGKISNQVVGLAPVAGMCTRSSSCTVNEGRHFESVFVISHEIGHNLGMRHDGPQADNDCDPTSHIMSPTLGSGKITWSLCSRKYLDMFLDTSQSKCLLDKARSELRLDHDADGRLPGERFDSDKQCVLKYGRGSFHATQQPLEDVCRDLHCRREHYTWTSHPALEGTYCGMEMWCRAGKCMRKSSSSSYYPHTSSKGSIGDLIGSNHLSDGETAAYSVQKAVDGVWGQWSLFTDCSSACLHSDSGSLSKGTTGIRLAARRCDSPRPENGGRQCSGPDRRYKTCSSSKVLNICAGTSSRSTVSEYANDVCSRAATADTELTGNGFMMSTNDADRACSVWCETLENGIPRSRGWSFPDGTSCKLISQTKAQSYCVAGKCQDFTCNPYSHYALSDEECSSSSVLSNEITPQSSWYTSSTLDTDSEGQFSGVGHTSIRNGKTSTTTTANNNNNNNGWSDWESHSECKLPCLAPAKGLELVKRHCSSHASCSGISLSVRICKPDKLSIIRNGCTRLQTPFEYATKVCSKYAEKISSLSGIGMQLSPMKEDKDRPCRIGCQDAAITYRFYMVNGEDGWFPAGTDCSRGDPDKNAFCVAGKCVDFGRDDTPIYRVNAKTIGKLETLFQQQQLQTRTKRQATYNILEPLKVSTAMDERSLKELVHRYSQDTGNFPSISQAAVGRNAIDWSRPVISHNAVDQAYSKYFSSTADNMDMTTPFRRGQPYAVLPTQQSTFSARSNSMDPSMYYPSTLSSYSSSRPTSDYSYNSNSWSRRGGRHLDTFNNAPQERLTDTNSNNLGNLPIEGSYYEWRKIVSDCSVSCGKGIQEVIVQCVSGNTVVSDNLCSSRPRPGHSGYVDCNRTICSSARKMETGHIWNWLQSVLPKNDSTH